MNICQHASPHRCSYCRYELFSRTLLKVYLKDTEHMQQFARSICQEGYRYVQVF